MKIPFDELNRMPTKDRKYFIKKHNEEVEEENEEYERRRNDGSSSTASIDRFTDMSQGKNRGA